MSRKSVAFVAAPIMDFGRDGTLRPSQQDADLESPQLGVYLLVGQLDKLGLEIDLIDWVAEQTKTIEEVIDQLSSYSVLFFSCNSLNWSIVRLLAQKIKKIDNRITTVVGGPHPTHYPESVQGSKCFDYYFRGEADRYIEKIYRFLVFGENEADSNIPGFASCNGKIPKINQENNLSLLDWNPAYYRLPEKKFLTIPVETSRGCKFQCTFCSIPAKKNWRGYEADFAASQIERANDFISKSKISRISIVDDTFTTDHQRTIQIMQHLDKSEYAKKLLFDATIVDLLNEELIESVAHFCGDLLVGAEVASKKDAKMIRKASTPQLIWRAAENLQRAGLSNSAVFSFIMGFPWHTKQDCIEIIRLVKNLVMKCHVRSYLQWYWPMPGSEVWRDLYNKGLVGHAMVDEIGFFRHHDWFYTIRELTPCDVVEIDEKAKLIQTIAGISVGLENAKSIEYSSPVRDLTKPNRAPHIVNETSKTSFG